MIKISDAFTLQMGKTPARANEEYWNDGSNPWVSIADLSSYNKYVTGTKETITDLGVAKSGIKVVPANTVIMSFKLSLGKTAITTAPVYTNEAIMAFIPNGRYEVDTDYLYHLFSGRDWSKGTNRAVMGATLNKATLSEIEITLPPLAEQKHIADILDKVNALINHRKEQLVELDELVKSRFIELFGDPVSNSKNLPELTLPELGEFGRGVSKHRPRNDPKLLGGEYPLIQTGEVANSELYITSYENTYSELGLKQSKMWQAGTLCITIAANIAKTAILTFDACFPDSVVGFKANDKTSNIFIHYWFSFFQAILEAQAPESAQKNINLKILSELKIIVPPIEQQNEFVAFVEQTDKSKLAVQNSIAELEELKKSLMQKYFG